MKIRRIFLLLAICYPFHNSPVLIAGGISSPNASMYLGNLKIGQTYSLQQLLGYPFTATYRGKSMNDMRIDLVIPKEPSSDGYEPLPDPNWIKIDRQDFTLDPGQSAETDIKITIPNDEKLLGKKFIAQINPKVGAPKEAGAGLAFGVALLCNLRLEISPRPATPDEERQLKQNLLGSNIEVLISPQRVFLNQLPVGKKIDIKRHYGQSVKILNSSDFRVMVFIDSILPSSKSIFPPEGYTETPDPSWLIPSVRKISIPPNTIKEIPFTIFIPPDRAIGGESIKGKKLYFAVSVRVESKIRSVNNIVRFFVETQPPENDKEPAK